MLRRFVPLVLVVLVAAGACSDTDGGGSEAAGDTSTTTTGEGDGRASGAARVELVDAGAEPRSELRLRPEVGATQLVTMRQAQDQELTMGGQTQAVEAPATELDIRFEIVSAEDGRYVAETLYAGSRVIDDGSDPQTVSQLRDALAAFDGATARTVFDDRSRIIDMETPDVELPPALQPVADQLLEGFDEQATSFSVPFPEEPVGVGARWRVTSELEIGGVPMTSTTEVTLTEVGEDTASADVTVDIDLVTGETVIAGSPATVESGALRGEGTVRWDLRGGAVPYTDQTVEGAMTLTVGQGGSARTITVDQRQQISVVPREG